MTERQPFTEAEVRSYQTRRDRGQKRADIARECGVSELRVKKALRTDTLMRLGVKGGGEAADAVVDAQQVINKHLMAGFTTDMFQPLEKRVRNYTKDRVRETAVLQITDPHVSKHNRIINLRTNQMEETYNYEIFQRELLHLRSGVGTICELLRPTYFLEKLVILLTGDMNDNDRIYRGQQLNIDRAVGDQVFDGLGCFGRFVVSLKTVFPTIEIYAVPGNHGRTTSDRSDEPATSSFDYILYKTLQLLFAGDTQVKVVPSPDYFYMVPIYDWRYLITHGDGIKSWGSLPFYGMARAGLQYLASVAPDERLDLLVSGHIHQTLHLPLSERLDWFTSASWVPRDKYSFQVFKTYPRTTQRFWGCNPKHRTTWMFNLDLQTGGWGR